MLSVFCRQRRFWCCFYHQIAACTVPSSSAPRHCFQGAWPFFLQAEVLVPFFVNLLFAQYRPGWMHLLATANYPRVMCFKNCLCLLPTGSFQGNSEKRWLFLPAIQGAWSCLCCKRKSRCPRPVSSRLDALARNSQVGDVSHELFVFNSKCAF